MKEKLIVFDLDGTICFSGTSIDQRIIKAIHSMEERGFTVIFASARPIRDMLPLIDKDFPKNMLIGGNGSIIRKENQLQVVCPIDAPSLQKLKELIKKYDLDYLLDDKWNYSLKNRNDLLANINQKIDAQKLAKNVPIEEITQAIKCNLLNLAQDTYENLKQAVQNLPLSNVIHTDNRSIDLSARGINKYSTLQNYFENTEYTAFGNDENDLELLKNAKLAILIGDNPSLKKFAHIHLKAEEKVITEFLDTL